MLLVYFLTNEIHLKIGGDHGGGTFKMSFQVGNVEHPNKPSNTIIFSHMEAKDYKSNLVLRLERFNYTFLNSPK